MDFRERHFALFSPARDRHGGGDTAGGVEGLHRGARRPGPSGTNGAQSAGGLCERGAIPHGQWHGNYPGLSTLMTSNVALVNHPTKRWHPCRACTKRRSGGVPRSGCRAQGTGGKHTCPPASLTRPLETNNLITCWQWRNWSDAWSRTAVLRWQ